jgi:ABC-type lipoprotein export system ATPase subunit
MTAALVADEVVFSYRNGTPLLERWSAEFYPGEVTAVTGPSGRGKSTLLYILGLMLKPNSGDVVVHGEPAAHASDVNRARLRANTFGFVFQDAALDSSRSVLDNVLETTLYRAQPRAAATSRALELLEQFEVAQRAHHKPGQVSGGQAQRIALCRALLGEPSILLADEPTGNLDAMTARVVMNSFRDVADRGTSVIVVTHDPSVMGSCDREIVL